MRKDEFIKIRISKKDKETLMTLSEKENESLSSFILRKSLCQESSVPNTLAPQINITNFVNEIYHSVNKSDNEKLKKEIIAICNTFLLNQRIRGKKNMKKEKSKTLQEDYLINNAGDKNYLTPESTENVIRYVTRTNKESKKDLLSWGGFGISESLGIQTVINQFQEVQKLHTRKGPFGRYMDHEWYSFSETSHAALLNYDVDLDALAREMAQDFYERDNCQVVYGVHKPDDGDKHIHIHFGINAVNFINGNKRRENMRQTEEREKRFREMTKRAIKRYSYGKILNM